MVSGVGVAHAASSMAPIIATSIKVDIFFITCLRSEWLGWLDIRALV
jgi:hypothetical protein